MRWSKRVDIVLMAALELTPTWKRNQATRQSSREYIQKESVATRSGLSVSFATGCSRQDGSYSTEHDVKHEVSSE
jgi:hypothetical protein